MSVILGLNTNHSDTSACLVVDGVLVAAISEERLGDRIKSTSNFPSRSISELCRNYGVDLKDITHIALSRNPRANLFPRVKYGLTGGYISSLKAFVPYLRKHVDTADYSLTSLVAKSLDQDVGEFKGKVQLVEHHLCHVSSSYYLSPFEADTLGFSYDASGDFVSLMLADCNGTQIKPYKRVFLPDSLGFFYSAICQHIGFNKFGEEYKVMGLAAYGEPSYLDRMNELVRFDTTNLYKLNRRYFRMHDGQASGTTDSDGSIVVDRIFTRAADQLLGRPRLREEEVEQHHKDLAASAQRHFTEVVVKLLDQTCRGTSYRRVAMAGGCALNGLTNQAIRERTPLEKQFIQPAASDDGTAVGAAMWTLHNVVGSKKRSELHNPFLGFSYDPTKLVADIRNKGKYGVFTSNSDEDLVDIISKYISNGAVVGWFQGRSEWGPRALGNRSIIANPCIKNMKEIINKKIKKREVFRPFAPSVLSEFFSTYFEGSSTSPFMQHIVPVRDEWKATFPAITHVDNTARVQTVSKSFNPLYYNLIQRLAAYTGHPILLNTSFNENEPIVETPEQAFKCFERTEIDYLVLGRHIISRRTSGF